MASVTVTHATLTGAAADTSALVDGPKWDAAHTVSGLENVDNTSDAAKPVSTATQTALDLKVGLAGTETITGVKTFGSAGAVGRLKVAGTTSGATVLDATAVASGTLTMPAATDTLVGRATTDTFTNKTFDTAGTGNSFSINGVAVTANTGTGSVVRGTDPTFGNNITVTNNITASGTAQTFGPGGTGSGANGRIFLNGSNAANSGAAMYFQRNSTNLFAFGNSSAILGGASNDFVVYSVTSGGGTVAAINVADASGNVTIASGVAAPAGGSTSARLLFGTTAGFGVYYGSGAPTVSAGQGSIYLRSDGSSTSTRLYVNTNGSTTWTNVTTAA
jgi:hypothetical protein